MRQKQHYTVTYKEKIDIIINLLEKTFIIGSKKSKVWTKTSTYVSINSPGLKRNLNVQLIFD